MYELGIIWFCLNGLLEHLDSLVIFLIAEVCVTIVEVVVLANLDLLRIEQSFSSFQRITIVLQLCLVKEYQTVQTSILGEFVGTKLSYLKALFIVFLEIAVCSIACKLIILHLIAVHFVVILDCLAQITCLIVNLSRNDVNRIVGTNLAEFFQLSHSRCWANSAVHLSIASVTIYTLGIHHCSLLKPT